jgi:hypothetical protein
MLRRDINYIIYQSFFPKASFEKIDLLSFELGPHIFNQYALKSISPSNFIIHPLILNLIEIVVV